MLKQKLQLIHPTNIAPGDLVFSSSGLLCSADPRDVQEEPWFTDSVAGCQLSIVISIDEERYRHWEATLVTYYDGRQVWVDSMPWTLRVVTAWIDEF